MAGIIVAVSETMDANRRAKLFLDLAKQAAERGNLTASAIFALASEVCQLTSALRGILLELISR